MIGGFTYTTQQGDMWDYIAWKIYGDEALVYLLYLENPKYLETFIFDEGVELYCPEVEINDYEDDEDAPDWQDDEDDDEDALDGVSDEGDEDEDES